MLASVDSADLLTLCEATPSGFRHAVVLGNFLQGGVRTVADPPIFQTLERFLMHPLRRILLVTSSLGLLAGCGTAHTVSTAPSAARPAHATAADSAAAHRAAAGFIAAFDSLQWEPFRAYFADDITMFFPFPQYPSRADGRQAVEEVFRPFMEAQRTRRAQAGQPMVQGLAPRDLRVQMAGPDAAIVTFHLGAAESPARRTVVFHRTADGQWKVVHWHASSAARPGT